MRYIRIEQEDWMKVKLLLQGIDLVELEEGCEKYTLELDWKLEELDLFR